MPDNALQASLQGRPRQAPDFSPLALAHLHPSCLAGHQLIEQYLSAPSQPRLGELMSAIKDIRQTLQLLNKFGAYLVSSELSQLLDAMAQLKVNDKDACEHTLMFAGQHLADFVDYLQHSGAIDSPLQLLPVINNCRACRNEELLSGSLMAVSGLELPDASSLPLPSPQQINTLVGQLTDSRQLMRNALESWFTDQSELHNSLSKLQEKFAQLSISCATATSLQQLQPLFDSAECICHSILTGTLSNSSALHGLFTQIEQLRCEYSEYKSDDAQAFAQPVPERLYLNMLYYVAVSSGTSSKAVALRERFHLDRFSVPDISTKRSQVEFTGINVALVDSIRDEIEIEIQAAIALVDDANGSQCVEEIEEIKSSADFVEKIDRARSGLARFEPALLLLGAHKSMRQVISIKESFAATGLSEELFQVGDLNRITDALARLDRTVDTEFNTICAANKDKQHNHLESILAACLSEAQLRLLSVEQDLINLFIVQAEESHAEQPLTITVEKVNAKLAEIDSALQVLPMPEISPIISGVQSFITRHENKVLSPSARNDLATVMVSLGYYLNSVLQRNGAAGQLLLEAEEALLNLDIERLEENDDTLSDGTFDVTRVLGAVGHSSEYDLTIVDHAADAEVEDFIDVSLQQMNVISGAVYEYEQAGLQGKLESQRVLRSEMIQAYGLLQDEAVKYKSTELEALAKSNIRLLKSTNDSPSTQALLEESVAVLPQLINQFHSGSDKIFELQSLLDRINDAAVEAEVEAEVEDQTLALDVQGTLAQSTLAGGPESPPAIEEFQEFDDTGALTQSLSWEQSHEIESIKELDNDGTESAPSSTLFDLTGDDVPVMTLDNTLEQVFYRECDQHILSLRQSVNDALAVDASQPAALNLAASHSGLGVHDTAAPHSLPNKDLLRALHTLTGSAQTVDAHGIIAIAQPLQKAALLKQRNGERFDRDEIKYIGELIDVLEARLIAMEAEQPFMDDNDAVTARLNEFIAHSTPRVPERKSGLQLNNNFGSIENIFQEEARELLDTLRLESARLANDTQRKDAIEKIQRCLHTIKGSARMAGQVTLADRAHALEDEIKLVEGVALDDVVRTGLGELQTLMLIEQPVGQPVGQQYEQPDVQDTDMLKHAEPMVLTEASFENMFMLASRATVSQAKLGESMLRLRNAYSDIESTSARLQRLPYDHTDLNSAAVAEMLSDLDSARRMLADALLVAESEHTQGLRADSALHQTLIRAQLVSFSECRTRLQHTATDAANETGKPIDFVLTGEELNIDKVMFRKLMTPLEHLIRNAVLHGIEPESERIASGKPAAGKVTVDVKIDGTDVLIEVSDDGAGIDQSRVNKALDSAGDEANKSNEKLLDILTEPGFTTHEDADQLGGRGLGLSTVKQLVDELDGNMQLGVPDNGGTVFALRLPQKIRINQIVLVEHQAHSYAIPVNFIHTVSDELYDLTQTSIQYNDTDYACCSLDAIITRDIATDTAASAKRYILMAVHGKHIALLVDKVVGYREIIAQPLGAQVLRLKRYLGGAVLADGSAVLIPDFNRLIDPEKSLPASNWSAANTGELNCTALIVDDSITMRIAAEQMLRNFAIEPSIARDGAEAVEHISQALPDVLLVDIDMPRMNGFDFLRHLRVLHPEHKIPIVMISTRDTDKDRNQARELGAMDYLVKPYTESQMRNALTGVGILSADPSIN